MALSFPLAKAVLVDTLGVVDCRFECPPRQEVSRTAGGVTLVKDLGPALWRARFVTRPWPHRDAARIEATLQALHGGLERFEAYDVRRSRPLHGAGVDYSAAAIDGYAGGRLIAVTGLPPGHVLEAGDYLAFDYGATPSRALHRVVERNVATGTGRHGGLEVRPFYRPGIAEGAPVVFDRPSGLFRLDPGSVEPRAAGPALTAITFSATQVLD